MLPHFHPIVEIQQAAYIWGRRNTYYTAGINNAMRIAITAITTRPAPPNALSPILIAIAVVSPTVSAAIFTGRPTFAGLFARVTTPVMVNRDSPFGRFSLLTESIEKCMFQSG